MSLLSEIFSWWGGNTWGTRVTTWWSGRLVGTDDAGNSYYQQKRGVGPHGLPRRWIVYKNGAEASQVPPGWYGWLHHTTELPPTESPYVPRTWERPHVPNLTGTANAYRPKGSILGEAERPKATGDYVAWKPDQK